MSTHKIIFILTLFVFGLFLTLSYNKKVEAVCNISCISGVCRQICTEPPPQITQPGRVIAPPACVDSDNGSYPEMYGVVTISSPALPEVKNDNCLTNKVTVNGVETTSQWVSGTTGTHVSEKTCVNTVTGVAASTVISCQNGCENGACKTSIAPNTPIPTKAPIPTITPIPTIPVIRCNSNGICPSGLMCVSLMCVRAPTITAASCTLRPQGDANCDQLFNDTDLGELRKKLNNLPLALNNKVDFNSDSKVDLVDYEIWRNSAYK